jgi:hypothetical protein
VTRSTVTMVTTGRTFPNRTCVHTGSTSSRGDRPPWLMGKVSILVAGLASVLCMAGLFVTVALAAGPHAQAGTHGKPALAWLCPLH